MAKEMITCAENEGPRVYYRFEEMDGTAEGAAEALQTFKAEGPPAPQQAGRPGFWRRQFQPKVTRGQKKFDWAFGVLLPVTCIFFDPIVFGADYGDGLLSAYKPFAYLLSYSAIMATIGWLLWGKRLKWIGAAVSGLFVVSFVASLAIGIVLLPFSLLGLAFFFIGALGFTPLFSAFVFLRNGFRSLSAAEHFLDRGSANRIFALSAMASALIPYLFNLR